MKKYYIITFCVLTISLLSCHSNSDNTTAKDANTAGKQGVIAETTNSIQQMEIKDTIGFSAFKAEKEKKYQDSLKLVGINEERKRQGKSPLVGNPSDPSTLVVEEDYPKTVENTSQSSEVYSNRSNTSTSSTHHRSSVKKKKGMSNGTKGALIGGGAGALTGALVTKHNRGVGALVGAAAGGGAGYLIGHSKDKKQSKQND